jgi:hypothetical protein
MSTGWSSRHKLELPTFGPMLEPIDPMIPDTDPTWTPIIPEPDPTHSPVGPEPAPAPSPSPEPAVPVESRREVPRGGALG